MKSRKIIVRVVALIMAVLIGLSVFAVLFQIFAADSAVLTSIAKTGSSSSPPWAVYVGLVAVLVVGLCIVLPKMLKKH